MSINGEIYIVQFNDGIFKLGSSQNANKRIKSLSSKEKKSIITQHIIPNTGDSYPNLGEQLIKLWIKENGGVIHKGHEWFKTIPHDMVFFIKKLSLFDGDDFWAGNIKVKLKIKKKEYLPKYWVYDHKDQIISN